MRYIYVGNPIRTDYLEKLKNKNYYSFADNKVQNKIINGLKKHYKDDLDVITVNREDKVTKEVFIDNNIKCVGIKCDERNLVLYYIYVLFGVTYNLYKIIKRNKKEKYIIITCGPYIYYSIPVIIMRMLYNIKYIPLLIASIYLPEYKGIYGIVSKLSIPAMKFADGTITYVEQSAIDYTNKPYAVILPSIDTYKPFEKNISLKRCKVINVLYYGALTEINGVDILLDVMELLPNNFILHICGSGPLQNLVIEKSKLDPSKIKYYGFVTYDEIRSIEEKMNILIVLRPFTKKIYKIHSKYSALSKLVEYLFSGIPVISTDIESINKQMRPFLNLVNSEDPKEIAKFIESISSRLDDDDIKEKAIKGRKFIIENANEKVQEEIINNFLDTNFK